MENNKEEILISLTNKLVIDGCNDELWLLGELIIGQHPSLQQSFLLLAGEEIPKELSDRLEESLNLELILLEDKVIYKDIICKVMGLDHIDKKKIWLSSANANPRSYYVYGKDIKFR
jgi:hypothetical protein